LITAEYDPQRSGGHRAAVTIFLEQLPEYHEEFDGGIAQFTSVHILRSEAGYAIGHILSPDVSGELIDIVPIIETVRATVPTDVHLLFPNQHGRLPMVELGG
jgi:hypothetical protein